MEKFIQLKAFVNSLEFATDVDKFSKGNNAAGTRVRKHLADLKRAAQAMRNEVQEIRAARKAS